MRLSEKISYLKGLMDGMEIDVTKKEGKVLLQVTEVMQEIADCIENLQNQVDEITELCDILDSDLGEVEEELYDFDNCCCEDDEDYENEDYDFDSDELYEVCCPECGDTVILDESMLEEGSIECPNCGMSLEFDFEEIEPVDVAGKDGEE